MGIFNLRKKKDAAFYFQKGALEKIEEIKKSHRESQAKNFQTVAHLNKTILGLDAEISMFSKAHELVELKYGKHDRAALIATIFPFIDLSILDIIILNKQYLNTKNDIEKNFICRTAALHMYEFLGDFSTIIGSQMKTITEGLKDGEINSELYGLRKSFNELKKEFYSPLKILRNNVSGHKDRNLKNQLSIINGINTVAFQRNFALFLLFFLKLMFFKNNLLDKVRKHQDSAMNPSDDIRNAD